MTARGRTLRDAAARHGGALLEVLLVSGLGIIASAGFQIVTVRGLGPVAYGTLASFLALINVASIGSTALRNSVAVSTARRTDGSGRRGRLDGPAVEALILGAAGTALVLLLAHGVRQAGADGWIALALTAAAITPYFWAARGQGLLQGAGDSRGVVWWTTGAQIGQFVLVACAILLHGGATAVLAAVLVCAIGAALGPSWSARRKSIIGESRAFTVHSLVVLLITLLFAWLTNADVIFVKALAGAHDAGVYASAAVLVKTTMIIPATLSLYLLPRFVRSRGDVRSTSLGVALMLGITFVFGLAMFLILLIIGGPIVRVLYGAQYSDAMSVLPWFALSWIPWALAQAILVRVTAVASKLGVAVLVLAAVVEAAVAFSVLPDIHAMILANGAIGVAVCVALYATHLLHLRDSRNARPPLPGSEAGTGRVAQ